MQKNFLMFMAIIFYSSCTKYIQKSALSENQFVLQSRAMVESIRNTPYAALIRITSVKKIVLKNRDELDKYSEQKFICNADVIETYRGKEKKNISFNMYVEMGEKPDFPKTPFIVTLCKSKEGFYWPGVGAVFSEDTRLKALARETSNKVGKKQQVFKDCE